MIQVLVVPGVPGLLRDSDAGGQLPSSGHVGGEFRGNGRVFVGEVFGDDLKVVGSWLVTDRVQECLGGVRQKDPLRVLRPIVAAI